MSWPFTCLQATSTNHVFAIPLRYFSTIKLLPISDIATRRKIIVYSQMAYALSMFLHYTLMTNKCNSGTPNLHW